MPSPDYEKYGRDYYLAHRDEILEREKTKKRWLKYYENNRAAVAERNRRRYYESRGLPVPEKRKTVNSESLPAASPTITPKSYPEIHLYTF